MVGYEDAETDLSHVIRYIFSRGALYQRTFYGGVFEGYLMVFIHVEVFHYFFFSSRKHAYIILTPLNPTFI